MIDRLSEEEFSALQDIRKQALEVATTLGEVSYQKLMLENKIDEQKIKIKQIKQTETEFFDALTKKYGDVILDIETGKLSEKVL
jgi:hypothetical protein